MVFPDACARLPNLQSLPMGLRVAQEACSATSSHMLMPATDSFTTAGATRPEKEFMNFLAQGRFMLQRSRSSGHYIHYPRIAEPWTGATDLDWVPASGRATVYAATVNRPRPPAPPYSLVLVDLAEGPRMMSRVEGIAPEDVRIGMQLQSRIAREGEHYLVVFDPL